MSALMSLSRSTASRFIVFQGLKKTGVRIYSSLSSLKECPNCQVARDIGPKKIKDALLSDDTYREMNKLAGKCKAFKNDHFQEYPVCPIVKMSDQIARAILREEPLPSVTCYDEDSAAIYPSAFLKIEKLAKDGTDLTGDGGKLALDVLLKKFEDLSVFKFVVDIGGQDGSFVKNFPKAKRIVIEKNLLSPFLEKSKEVEFAIGDVQEVMKKVISKDREGLTLFSMSNFINVIPPDEAWKSVALIGDYMHKGDVFIVTNLDHAQFKGRTGYGEGYSRKGITHFYKGSDSYKTVIDSQFRLEVEKAIPGLRCVSEKESSMMIHIESGKLGAEKYKKAEGKFRTVMFIMFVKE